MHDARIIVQARLLSTRFPSKILQEIGERSIIEIVYDNCIRTGYKTNIVVPFGEKHVIFRHVMCPFDDMIEGSEYDVLSRFYDCAKSYSNKILVRITSDCPLIAPEIIKDCVNYFVSAGATYLTTTNLNVGEYSSKTCFPDGFDVEVFTFAALSEAYKHASYGPDREHVTPWIRKNLGCIVYNPGKILLPLNNKYSIDTEEDFERIKPIIESRKSVWTR